MRYDPYRGSLGVKGLNKLAFTIQKIPTKIPPVTQLKIHHTITLYISEADIQKLYENPQNLLAAEASLSVSIQSKNTLHLWPVSRVSNLARPAVCNINY